MPNVQQHQLCRRAVPGVCLRRRYCHLCLPLALARPVLLCGTAISMCACALLLARHGWCRCRSPRPVHEEPAYCSFGGGYACIIRLWYTYGSLTSRYWSRTQVRTSSRAHPAPQISGNKDSPRLHLALNAHTRTVSAPRAATPTSFSRARAAGKTTASRAPHVAVLRATLDSTFYYCRGPALQWPCTLVCTTYLLASTTAQYVQSTISLFSSAAFTPPTPLAWFVLSVCFQIAQRRVRGKVRRIYLQPVPRRFIQGEQRQRHEVQGAANTRVCERRCRVRILRIMARCWFQRFAVRKQKLQFFLRVGLLRWPDPMPPGSVIALLTIFVLTNAVGRATILLQTRCVFLQDSKLQTWAAKRYLPCTLQFDCVLRLLLVFAFAAIIHAVSTDRYTHHRLPLHCWLTRPVCRVCCKLFNAADAF